MLVLFGWARERDRTLTIVLGSRPLLNSGFLFSPASSASPASPLLVRVLPIPPTAWFYKLRLVLERGEPQHSPRSFEGKRGQVPRRQDKLDSRICTKRGNVHQETRTVGNCSPDSSLPKLPYFNCWGV